MKLILYLLCLSSLAFSQFDQIGVMAGVNIFNSVSLDNPDKTPDGTLESFAFGAKFIFGKQRRSEWEISALSDIKFALFKDETNTFTERFHYITLSLKYVYRLERKQGFRFGLGPALGVNLSADTEIENAAGSLILDNPDAETVRYSVQALVSYEFLSGLFFDLGYDLGLSDSDEDGKSVFSSVQLTTGWYFN